MGMNQSSTGRVRFFDGRGDLPMMDISTPWSSAGIYLHGAHVTHFEKEGEKPLLFLSHCSRFSNHDPIRGGIPIIFPWFGPKEGFGQHGYARVKNWQLKEFMPAADGSVSVRFQLPFCAEAKALPACRVEYIVTVNEKLTCELVISNDSDAPFSFEDCLHTYFAVGDIAQVSVSGLKDASYFDKVENFERKTETNDGIRVGSEVDRIYLDTTSETQIIDASLKRRIRIAKTNSRSTVVWNPWIAKAQQMPDFGNEEYKEMLCVESGNVADNAVTLAARKEHRTSIRLSSEPL
jgi:D-hexose-6-phosphate mutarotase